MSCEIMADDYCELQDLLRYEAIEEINYLFAEAFEVSFETILYL